MGKNYSDIDVSLPTRLMLLVAAVGIYLLALTQLSPFIGRSTSIFSIIPIVVAGWYFGIWGGAISSIIIAPINILLLSYTFDIQWTTLINQGLGIASLGAVSIGLLIGYSSNIRGRLLQMRYTLEQRVNERTESLIKTNESLQQEIKVRKQAEADSQMRERFFALLNDLTKTALEAQNFQTMMQALADRTAGLLQSDDCCLTGWDEATETAIPIASSGPLREIYPTLKAQPGESTVTAAVIKANTPLIIEDAYNTVHISQRISQLFPTRSMLGLPLVAHEKRIGALLFTYEKQHNFTEQEVAYGELAARQIALAIAKIQLYETANKQARQLQSLYQVSLDISLLRDMHLVLKRIFNHAMSLFNVKQGGVFLLNPTTKQLEGHIGFPYKKEGRAISPGEGVAGQVYITRKYVLVGNYQEWEHCSEKWNEIEGSVIGVPIQWGDTFFGVLNIHDPEVNRFTNEDARTLMQFAHQAAVGIQNAKLYEAIQQQARQMEQVLDSVSDGIILLDRNGFVKLTNPAASTYLQDLTNGHMGKQLIELAGQPLNHLLVSDKTGPIELSLTRKDQKERIFEITPHPIQIKEEIEGWVLILHDATLDRQIQSRMQEQDRLAVVGQLAAGIAHDFNNILTSIIGFADLMKRKTETVPANQNALELIVQQGQRGAQLIRQILDFSRQSVLTKETLNMVEYLQDLVRLLQRTIPENIQISLTISPSQDEYYLCGDPAQLQQAITNLTINARDAMPQGGHL
ncbi:MAG: GAF domain-containing protein, partial [Chloroflexota bacterium]